MSFRASLLLAICAPLLAAAPESMLRYSAPASTWTEALPVGNGRLGAMVFGDPRHERIALNEATLWSGGPTEWNNPAAREFLPQVRTAIAEGRYADAVALCKKMQGPYNQSYLPLGDLRIDFPGDTPATDYRRALDLDRAVATVSYREGDATFTREIFSSFPDQIVVVRLTCDQPGRIAFTAALASQLRHAVSAVSPHELVPEKPRPTSNPTTSATNPSPSATTRAPAPRA